MTKATTATPSLTPCILESPFAAPKALRDALSRTHREHRDSMVRAAPDREQIRLHEAYEGAHKAVQAAEAKHARYLKALARYAFAQGFAPFASHALYTQWLDDTDPAERTQGIYAGFAIADALDGDSLGRGEGPGGQLVVLVGADLGISPGMELGIKLHKDLGRDVREVLLGPDWGRKTPRKGGTP